MKSLFLAMLITFVCVNAIANEPLDSISESLVKIEVTQVFIRGTETEVIHGRGTGFFLSDKGVLVTAAHVVKNATDIKVYTSDAPLKPRRAKVIIVDKYPGSDLAIMRVRGIKSKPLVFCSGNLPGQEFAAYAWRFSKVERLLGKFSGVDYLKKRWITTVQVVLGFSGGPMYYHAGRCVAGVTTAVSYLRDTTLYTRPEISKEIMKALVKHAPESIGMTK